ncbi:MAG: 16S rRNA (guanine(966)-N(2))-methyltransferase RsmD [Armatimonadota bacterium]|nr:16S rRNA (guanine(966)-N(2))-methyltransferase RsmD [Armatimonadota bacterium]
MTGARGHRPSRLAVRPTAARVRGALYDSLGPSIEGAEVLDLFAGTGALGLEALRRGASRAVFVERDRERCQQIRQSLERAGLLARAQVYADDAVAAVARLGRAGARFDLVVLDPPYGEAWVDRTLAVLVGAGVVRPGGLIVAEGHWRDRPALPAGVVLAKEARYGETALWYIRVESEQQI